MEKGPQLSAGLSLRGGRGDEGGAGGVVGFSDAGGTGSQAPQTGAHSAPGTHQFADVLTPHLALHGLLPVQRDPQQPVEQEAQTLHAGAQGEERAVETRLDVEPAEEKQPRFCELQLLEGSEAHSSFINQESRKD